MNKRFALISKKFLPFYIMLTVAFILPGCSLTTKAPVTTLDPPVGYTDDVTQWKMYRSEKDGYEIKFPRYLEDKGVLYFPESDYKNTSFDLPAIEISSFPNLGALCLIAIDGKPKTEYLDKNKIESIEQFNKINVQKRIINGVVGYREMWKDAGAWTLAGRDGAAFRIEYYFPHGEICYKMRLVLDSLNREEKFNNTKFEDVFEKVVSTFRILKKI